MVPYVDGALAVALGVIGLITAGLVLITAGLAFANAIVSWRTRKQVKEVHVMVNSQRTDMMAQLDQLKALLGKSGVAVPPPPMGDRTHKERS